MQQCMELTGTNRPRAFESVKVHHGPLVKWLRQRPLTPLTSVRIRYGSPLKSKFQIPRFAPRGKARSFHCFFVSAPQTLRWFALREETGKRKGLDKRKRVQYNTVVFRRGRMTYSWC